MITIKSKREIEYMRAVGKLAAECLEEMGKLVVEGATGLDIDRACHDWTIAKKAIPAPLNYRGFPNSLCVSINDVVCHGIPHNTAFKNGDIVNLDVTPILDGYHGDTNRTFFVGEVAEETKKLVETTHKALWTGINVVKPGAHIGDIGYAIQNFINTTNYSIVLEYCGHGIGRNFHEDPMIVHTGKKGHGPIIKEGMTFTIEPMINAGKRYTYVDDDGWTVYTKDGSLSAQFEHTILVTADGCEVLTLGNDSPS